MLLFLRRFARWLCSMAAPIMRSVGLCRYLAWAEVWTFVLQPPSLPGFGGAGIERACAVFAKRHFWVREIETRLCSKLWLTNTCGCTAKKDAMKAYDRPHSLAYKPYCACLCSFCFQCWRNSLKAHPSLGPGAHSRAFCTSLCGGSKGKP